MITIFSDSPLTPQPFGFAELKTVLVEPALALGAAFFWIAALPLVAFFFMCVKIWDTLIALASRAGVRPNPLILRRGLARTSLVARSTRGAAQV